jgi:predicted TIM-barrel enzyme
MNRSEFHQLFGTPRPVILPVIHVLDKVQTSDNIEILIDLGIPGCFLINHDFSIEFFLPIIRSIRSTYPDFWIGLNFLAVTGLRAFPIISSLEKEGFRIDAYWADDARIDERIDTQHEAEAIDKMRMKCGWQGIYFGGTAFKKQRLVKPQDYEIAARIAGNHMDVVTTSGIATGNAAEVSKILRFRDAIPDIPIAIASGITFKNGQNYSMVDCFMVATGININNDFYKIDPDKLRQLIICCSNMESQI